MPFLGTVASVGYYVLCLYSAARFLGERKAAGEGARPTQSTPFTPAVSILKPLRGTDPEMYESFRSHGLQDYPQYEIIFGVSDAGDPAIEFVERLKAEFPQIPIRLVLCQRNLGANTKVSNLAQMVTEAQYEHIVVNDSDIRVQSNYLREVVAPLADPKVGLVTCLYRGVASPSLGARLESLSISTDFSAWSTGGASTGRRHSFWAGLDSGFPSCATSRPRAGLRLFRIISPMTTNSVDALPGWVWGSSFPRPWSKLFCRAMT